MIKLRTQVSLSRTVACAGRQDRAEGQRREADALLLRSFLLYLPHGWSAAAVEWQRCWSQGPSAAWLLGLCWMSGHSQGHLLQ